jgi:hypothetical protein
MECISSRRLPAVGSRGGGMTSPSGEVIGVSIVDVAEVEAVEEVVVVSIGADVDLVRLEVAVVSSPEGPHEARANATKVSTQREMVKVLGERRNRMATPFGAQHVRSP